MNDKNYFALGLFFLVGVSLFVIAIVYYAMQSYNKASFSFVTYFDEPVPGLKVGNPVRIRGVLVGEIDSIHLAPDHKLIEVGFICYEEELHNFGVDLQRVRDAQGSSTRVDEEVRMKKISNPITGISYLDMDVPKKVPPMMELSFTPPRKYISSMESGIAGVLQRYNDAFEPLPKMINNIAGLADKATTVFGDNALPETIRRANKLLATLDDEVEKTTLTARKEIESLSLEAERIMKNLDQQIAAIGNNTQGLTAMNGPVGNLLAQIQQEVKGAQLPQTFKEARFLLRSVASLSGQIQYIMPDAEHLVRYTQEFMRNLSQQPGSLIHGLRKQE